MKNLIFIVLIISLLQSSTLTYNRYSSHDLDFDEILDLLERSSPNDIVKIYSKLNNKQHDYYDFDVDPNDRVHVKKWNRLNAEDIKNMPKIDNYSSEATAAHWLRWYLRVSQRFGQVRLKK